MTDFVSHIVPLHPDNLITVQDFRKFARAIGRRSHNAAFRIFAERRGYAQMLLADDTLVTLTREEDGRMHRRSYKPGSWTWATGEDADRVRRDFLLHGKM